MFKTKFILFLLLISCVTGCTRIKSEKEVLKYAKNKFGSVELINKQQNDGENPKYTLKDEKNNFIYECFPYISDFSIDGTTLFKVSKISCSFDKSYKEFIYDKIKGNDFIIENNIELYIPNEGMYFDGKDSFQSFYINIKNIVTESVYVKILKKIKEIDERNYFNDFALEIYDKNTEKRIGAITTKDYVLRTNNDERDNWFIEYAKRTYNSSTNDDFDEIEFLRKESDVLIKNHSHIYNKLLTRVDEKQKEELQTATTTIYYFYDNIAQIEFYIIDYYVSGQACYLNNYSAKVRNEQTLYDCMWWKKLFMLLIKLRENNKTLNFFF